MTTLPFANKVPLTFTFQRGMRAFCNFHLHPTVLLIISYPCVHSFSFLIGMRVVCMRHLSFIKLPKMDLM